MSAGERGSIGVCVLRKICYTFYMLNNRDYFSKGARYRWILASLLCSLMPALAQSQQLMASHQNWRVFTAKQGGETLCYIASLPIRKQGNYSKRGDAYVYVTHQSGNQDEVSLSAGYPFKKDSDVDVKFGQKSYAFFTDDELAWAKDAETDRAVVKEMIRGDTMVVRGTSWKDTYSKDTYSLRGFTAAHRKMKQLCKSD